MSEYIKNLIGTKGWKEVEVMFEKAIYDLENKTINENLSAQEYKILHLSNKMASKRMKKLLKDIRLGKAVLNAKTKSYK